MLALVQSSEPKRTRRLVSPSVCPGQKCEHTGTRLLPTWKVKREMGWGLCSWERLLSSQALCARMQTGQEQEGDSLQRTWNSWHGASSSPLPLKHPWSQDAGFNDSVVCLAVVHLVFLEGININTFFCLSGFFFPLPIVMLLISLSAVCPQCQRKLRSIIPSTAQPAIKLLSAKHNMQKGGFFPWFFFFFLSFLAGSGKGLFPGRRKSQPWLQAATDNSQHMVREGASAYHIR